MTTVQRHANPAADPRNTAELIQRYQETRAFTERMCDPMEIEDYVIHAGHVTDGLQPLLRSLRKAAGELNLEFQRTPAERT